MEVLLRFSPLLWWRHRRLSEPNRWHYLYCSDVTCRWVEWNQKRCSHDPAEGLHVGRGCVYRKGLRGLLVWSRYERWVLTSSMLVKLKWKILNISTVKTAILDDKHNHSSLIYKMFYDSFQPQSNKCETKTSQQTKQQTEVQVKYVPSAVLCRWTGLLLSEWLMCLLDLSIRAALRGAQTDGNTAV